MRHSVSFVIVSATLTNIASSLCVVCTCPEKFDTWYYTAFETMSCLAIKIASSRKLRLSWDNIRRNAHVGKEETINHKQIAILKITFHSSYLSRIVRGQRYAVSESLHIQVGCLLYNKQ